MNVVEKKQQNKTSNSIEGRKVIISHDPLQPLSAAQFPHLKVNHWQSGMIGVCLSRPLPILPDF